MPRVLSITAREAFNAPATGEDVITLVAIRSTELDNPFYLASDWTEVLSQDPLKYGVTSNGITYEFVLMSAVLPDDNEGSPPSVQLVFANVDSIADDMGLDVGEGLSGVARSVRKPFQVDMSIVLASAPDDIEDRQILALDGVSAQYNAERLTINLSREHATSQPYPAYRMTRNRFPAMFRY